MTKPEPTLPSNRAFVVQFRSTTEPASGHWAGRVEHMTSGQATRFHSLDELVSFIEQVLTSVKEKPP